MPVTRKTLFRRKKHPGFAQGKSFDSSDEILSLGGPEIKDLVQNVWHRGWAGKRSVHPMFEAFCWTRATVRAVVLGDPE